MRRDSAGIFRAVFGGLVKLAETGVPFFGNHSAHTPAVTNIGGSDEISIRTPDTAALIMS